MPTRPAPESSRHHRSAAARHRSAAGRSRYRVEPPEGAVGELVVRGPQVMKGYFNNPRGDGGGAARRLALHRRRGPRDADGYYTIVDRKSDIIKTSGFLVFPAEVEELLRAYPRCGRGGGRRRARRERGELVKALSCRATAGPRCGGAGRPLQAHLSKHKRPRKIEVVRELPKNFLGKVLRRKLREAVPTLPGSAGRLVTVVSGQWSARQAKQGALRPCLACFLC